MSSYLESSVSHIPCFPMQPYAGLSAVRRSGQWWLDKFDKENLAQLLSTTLRNQHFDHFKG